MAELPLWIPDVPDAAGIWAVSGASAKAAGLRTRPFGDSVRDTWHWLESGGEVQTAPGTPPLGLASSKEQQVLAAWDSQLRPGTVRAMADRPSEALPASRHDPGRARTRPVPGRD